MSVLIKGMTMPKNCNTCLLSCSRSLVYIGKGEERNANCPLVEVPPHGRLIDADALIKHMKRDPLFPLVDRYGVTDVIQAASTIIEAEEVAS